MTLQELKDKLETIIKSNPEAGDNEIIIIKYNNDMGHFDDYPLKDSDVSIIGNVLMLEARNY